MRDDDDDDDDDDLLLSMRVARVSFYLVKLCTSEGFSLDLYAGTFVAFI